MQTNNIYFIILLAFTAYILYYYFNIFVTLCVKIFFRKRSRNNNILYLTFDDGPDPESTEHILNLFKEHNIRATFFLIGEKCIKYPNIVTRIKDEGHSIGIHGFRHFHAWKTFFVIYILDFIRMHILLKKHFNIATRIYRPPYGKVTFLSFIISKLFGYKIVLWDIDPKDYEISNSDNQFGNNYITVSGDLIILLHDGRIREITNYKKTYNIITHLIAYSHDNNIELKAIF